MAGNRSTIGPIHRHLSRSSYHVVMPGDGVRFLVEEDQRLRTYTVAHASQLLGMSERTLHRQVQNGTSEIRKYWAPHTDANTTRMWLLAADEVDEIAHARGRPTPASLVVVENAGQDRETASLLARIETLELEAAVRYRDRVQELERENAALRRQLEVMAAEAQRALTAAANIVGSFRPDVVSNAS